MNEIMCNAWEKHDALYLRRNILDCPQISTTCTDCISTIYIIFLPLILYSLALSLMKCFFGILYSCIC